MSIELTVISEIERIAEQHQKKLAPPTDESILMNSRHKSCCFAVLMARFEDRFGVDPFPTSDDTNLPPVLGDFVRICENAAN
jgi:hypothetical protein